MDLAKVIKEIVQADEDVSDKCRRASSVGTADNLIGNTQENSAPDSDDLFAPNKSTLTVIEEILPPYLPSTNIRPKTPKTGSTPTYSLSPLAFRPSLEAVRSRPTPSQ